MFQGSVIASGSHKELFESGLNVDTFLESKENYESDSKSSFDNLLNPCSQPVLETIQVRNFSFP